MRRARDLDVADRTTLAVGLVEHLAGVLDRDRMSRLMRELEREAARVRDVPADHARDERATRARPDGREHASPMGDELGDRAFAADAGSHQGVGQGGRGEFRGQKLL
jgi:hypothetical protein